MSNRYTFFATCPKNVEDLLESELRTLGALSTRATKAGVAFQGSMETGMAACLWSRIASRIFLPLARFSVSDVDTLYEAVRAIPWEDHFYSGKTFAVDARISSSGIRHSRYAALKTKDAIVDRFRERCGSRPSVKTFQPDLRINVHVLKESATVSLDLSGESLHMRGYRTQRGTAPLKENLASAVLLRAGWPAAAAGNRPLVDPMCGSGTIPIEAALMAGDVAPGLKRRHFGFLGWSQFKGGIWRRLLVDARFRAKDGMRHLPVIAGHDIDDQVLRVACANLRRAGMEEKVVLERRDVRSLAPPGRSGVPGLVVTNPPYGGRLGDKKDLISLYSDLGKVLKDRFGLWEVALFTGEPELARETGLKAHRKHVLYNGSTRCELLHFQIRGEPRDDRESE